MDTGHRPVVKEVTVSGAEHSERDLRLFSSIDVQVIVILSPAGVALGIHLPPTLCYISQMLSFC